MNTLPKGWAEVALGDVCELVRGVTYQKTDVANSEQPDYVPLLRAGNLKAHARVELSDLVWVPNRCVSGSQQLQHGDVVIATSSGSLDVVGKASVWNGSGDCTFGAFCMVARPTSDVDPAFFAHFFRTVDYRRSVSALAAGANINNLRKTDLAAMSLPLPPLDEQRRIAAILDKADELRAKRRAALEQLDSLTQAIFLDMFGDPGTNPRRWPVVTVGEVASVGTGATPDRSLAEYYGGTIPWVKTTEVTGRPITEVSEFITERALAETNCTIYPPGAVVIAMYGQGSTRGRSSVLQTAAATNQACAVVVAGDLLDPVYLHTVFAVSYDRLRSLGRGGNQANLNLSIVKSFGLPLPPIEAQAEFATRTSVIERIRSRNQVEITALDELFASLQSRAFRGEL